MTTRGGGGGDGLGACKPGRKELPKAEAREGEGRGKRLKLGGETCCWAESRKRDH